MCWCTVGHNEINIRFLNSIDFDINILINSDVMLMVVPNYRFFCIEFYPCGFWANICSHFQPISLMDMICLFVYFIIFLWFLVDYSLWIKRYMNICYFYLFLVFKPTSAIERYTKLFGRDNRHVTSLATKIFVLMISAKWEVSRIVF